MQQYNSKIVKNTIQFMHTWILKDEQVDRHLHSTLSDLQWPSLYTLYFPQTAAFNRNCANTLQLDDTIPYGTMQLICLSGPDST